MSRRGRALRAVLAFVLLVIVLVLLGFFPQGILRRQVESRLQEGLGPGSSVRQMRTVPWRLRTEVQDLVIAGPTYRLVVPRARLVLTPSFLLGRSLSFRSLEMESPRLEVTPGAVGGKPYQPLDKALVVEDLRVTDGTIVYHLSKDSELTLAGVSMKGSVGVGALDVATSGGTWRQDTTVALGPAKGRLRVSSRLDIGIDSLEGGAGNSQARVSGSLGRIGNLDPRLKVQAQVDLRDLDRFGIGPEMSGTVSASGGLSGTADELDVDMRVEGGRVRISGWEVDRFTGEVRHTGMADGRTRLDLDARLFGGSAKGEAQLVGSNAQGRVRFASIDVDSLRRQGVALPWPTAGAISGEATAKGDWKGALAVTARAATAGPGPAALALSASLSAEGAVRPRTGTMDVAFQLGVEGTRPAKGALPRLRTAHLTARGRVHGAMPPAVEASYTGALQVETVAGLEPVPVSGTVRASRGDIAFTADARGLGGALTAEGDVRGGAVRRLQARGTNIALALLRPGAEGRADFQVSASGGWDRLGGSATAQLHDLTWNGPRIGEVTAEATGSEGRGRFTFAATELRATGTGTFDPRTVEATITLDRTPVERVAAFFPLPRPVTGQTSGTVVVTVPLPDPRAAVAVAHLDTLDLASGPLSARATAPLIATVDERVLDVQQLRAEGNGVSAAVSGRFGLQATAPIEARVQFAVDLTKVPHAQDLVVTGKAAGDVTLTGTRERPRGFGGVLLTGIAIQNPQAAALLTLQDARIDLQGDVAVLQNLEGTLGGGRVEVTGTIPVAALLPATGAERLGLTPGVSAQLSAHWEGVQAAAVMEVLRPGPSSVHATLTGDATVSGTVGSWRDARGELSLTPTAVRVQDLDVEVLPLVVRLEAGRLTTDGLVVNAEGTTFRVDGSADLRSRTFQANGRGSLQLRTLSPLLEEVSLTGLGDVDVEASGPFASPAATGTIRIVEATLRARDIRQPLTGINALVTVDQRQVRVTEGVAELGGGPVTFQGTARLAGLSVEDVNLGLTAREVGLRYPVGGRGGRVRQILSDLKARVDADLRLTGKPGDFLLAGSLAVERSLYDTDIFLEEALLAPAAPIVAPPPSRLLQSIALNLAVITTSPLIVRNNLAQIEAEGGLSVRGDMANPAPFGRFDILPGGKIFIQARELTVEDGTLTYTGTTEPDLNVRATTIIKSPAQDVEVTVVASGAMPLVTLDLSSNPSLSQQEIASLIATGRSDLTNVASGGWAVGEQAGTLLLSRFTRKVAKQLIDLGFDQVDIQPELLAREGNPSARFTFGKQLTPALRVIYSMGLSNPEEQYYEAQYAIRLGQQITFKLQRRFDGTYQYGAGQRISFGGPPRTRAVPATLETTTLREVRFEGELPEFADAKQAAKAHPGGKVAYWDLLDDVDRIRKRLVSDGYLEAVVNARLDDDVAVFTGVAGRRHRWRVEGMTQPPNIDALIKGALFAEEGIDKARQAILEELRRRGHLRANVEVRTVMEGAFHTMVFEAQPGPSVTADVSFPGSALLSNRVLLDAAGGPATLLTRPRDAEEGIRAAYRLASHLVAKVGPTREAADGGVVRIAVPIEEGPEAKVAAVRFDGASLPQDELRELAALRTGVPYDPNAVDQAVLRLRDRYLRRGYAAVRVNPRVEQAGPDLDVVFGVHEGQAQTIGRIEITGLRRTNAAFVRRQLRGLKPGQPLDPRKLASAERRLRQLGIFRRAVLSASPDNPATITAELEEAAPYNLAYEARYNQQDWLNGSVDGQVQNLFGRGIGLGLRVQAGRWSREGRASLHLPIALHLGDLTISAFDLRQTIRTAFSSPPGGTPPPLDVGRRAEQGVQLQQSVHRFRPWEILYGYRYRRLTCPGQGLPPVTHTIRGIVDPCDRSSLERMAPLGPNPIPIDVGALDSSFVRDTRDNPLNPSRGSFLGLNLSVASRLLGSDFDYVRELAQASFNTPIGETLTWSQHYSIGAIHTFSGDRLPVSDLFKAGGANTVRGYGTESLGPRTPAGDALGGGATIVLNQELRYQHASGFGAAVFYDGGDVFERTRNLELRLRHSVGIGLRYASGFGLVRFDVGFPLNKRPEDRSYQLWFGFGQAF